MHTLILFRHAKSSWEDSSLADRDRPLDPRGRRAAPAMGEWLGEHGPPPDLVLSSPSHRTRQTVELALDAMEARPEVRWVDGLYLADPGDMIDLVRGIDEDVATAVLVGHNPGMHDLARALAHLNEPGSAKEHQRLRSKFPTGAMALFRFEGRWADVGPEGTVLQRFVRPKDLPDAEARGL